MSIGRRRTDRSLKYIFTLRFRFQSKRQPTFDICIETSGKVFPLKTVIKDSYPDLRKNLLSNDSQVSNLKYDIGPRRFSKPLKIWVCTTTNLIPCKDDMGPGSTLGHPVPAPPSLETIVFSLNLDFVCQTSVLGKVTSIWENIGEYLQGNT